MKDVVLTLGFFDGVHIGHQELLKKLVNDAEKLNSRSVVITFDDLPKVSQGCLTTLEERMGLLKNFGIDEINLLRFKDISDLTPSAFFEKFILKQYKIRAILVGSNFRFGRGRKGDVFTLKSLCQRNSIMLSVLKLKRYKSNGKEYVVSSSLIRDMLSGGNIELANELLGRVYAFKSKVVKGSGMGRKIGFPTANLDLKNNPKILPSGVFFCITRIDGRIYPAVTNIGLNPTISEANKRLKFETYIIGLNGMLTGKEIEVGFLSKIRDEKKFQDVRLLKEQITSDINFVFKKWLKK